MTKERREGLKAIEQFIAAELEQRMAGGESCDSCAGTGERYIYAATGIRSPDVRTCPDCDGTGQSPAIAEAEEALKALRREMERVDELRKWAALRLKGLRITRTGHVPADTFCRAIERVLAILDAPNPVTPSESEALLDRMEKWAKKELETCQACYLPDPNHDEAADLMQAAQHLADIKALRARFEAAG